MDPFCNEDRSGDPTERKKLMKKEKHEKTTDGDFPDYTKVIPKGNPHIAKVEHDELLQAPRLGANEICR